MKYLVLEAAGPHAENTSQLFWFITAVEVIVFLLVIGFLFWSLWRRRSPALAVPAQPSLVSERATAKFVAIAIAVTVLILTSFVAASYVVDRRLVDLDQETSMDIEVTAHQWWWEVRYLNKNPSEVFTTANEIHVPVGATVKLMLKSSDVIHSIWFPNLAGKKDIIPGRNGDLVIRADRIGSWLGRCAEYCGLQHANMGLTVVAEDASKFEAWKVAQREPAFDPTTTEAIRGREVYLKSPCVLCHAIRTRESSAMSNQAPDLTHLKSRAFIGANAAANTKANVGGWILDPHGIKPGVHMPTILQEPRDFQALLTYMETLK